MRNWGIEAPVKWAVSRNEIVNGYRLFVIRGEKMADFSDIW